MLKKITHFLEESKNEMLHHVTWSSFKELQGSSGLVLIGVAIFSVIVGVIDALFKFAMSSLTSLF